jgi:phytoene synthase
MPPDLATLARHGRTFRLTGRLLPRATLARAASLYAFCRAVDDMADEGVNQQAARTGLLGLRRAVLAGDASHLLAARFLALRTDAGASTDAAVALIDTVLSDLGPVRVPDEATLLRYAYGAAGTVGLQMCAVLNVSDPHAAPYAIDLGIAMQLTNIARDVAEDAAQDRLYLPATWLPPGLEPAGVMDATGPVFDAVQAVLARAGHRYRSAAQGFHYLPARVRPAIRAAARLYEEIGVQVLRQGPGYLHAGRCVVSLPRKVALLAGCLANRAPVGPHDPLLHTALRGLPGVRA